MSSDDLKQKNFIQRLIGYSDNKKNFVRIFFCIIIFLTVAKIPSIFISDMQPWDEGMYSTRVLAIHQFGDFFDQTEHSVQGLYSSSHPPLLVWLGYIFTLIFGNHVWVFKIIPFIFALLCIYLTIRIGEKLHSLSVGYFAALMIAGNILFSVYAVRFQFDYPYLFFILWAVDVFLIFSESGNKINILYLGIIFGLCLMTKILVGILIPGIFFITFFFIYKKIKVTFSDLIYISLIGILIALPWHIYMFAKYGKTFFDWFFSFHIFQRALFGVEQNTKNSGILFHINFIVSIIPYSLLSFWALLKYIFNFKKLSWNKIFLTVWFSLGLLIITFFKTKLETYSLLIMPQAALMLGLYLKDIKMLSRKEKTLALTLLLLNILWSLTYTSRDTLKLILLNRHNLIFILPASVLLIAIIVLIFYKFSDKLRPAVIYSASAILFFIGINIVHFLHVPYWADSYHLSEIKSEVIQSNVRNIIYVSSDYRANPQFTYYFSGLNLDWENKDFTYKQLDLKKDGIDKVRAELDKLNPDDVNIIIEKDGINRTDYDSTYLFMPYKFKFIKKTSGYELYR